MLKHLRDISSTKIEVGEGASIQVLISSEEAPHFAMRKFVIRAGGHIPNHTNTVEHEQFVLAGRAKVGMGEQVYEVGPDDILFIPAGVPHWYQVIGDEDYEFLCLIPNQEDRIELVEPTTC